MLGQVLQALQDGEAGNFRSTRIRAAIFSPGGIGDTIACPATDLGTLAVLKPTDASMRLRTVAPSFPELHVAIRDITAPS
jgi:hypothetical protein